MNEVGVEMEDAVNKTEGLISNTSPEIFDFQKTGPTKLRILGYGV